MKALSIRQPHAEAIMRGVKTVEYRSRPTRMRERFYIYAAQGRYSRVQEAEMMEQYGIDDVSCDELARGVLIGTVELSDCTGSPGDYEWHVESPERAKRMRKPAKHPQPAWFNPF